MGVFSNEKIQVGISACLLGQKVRYDRGHKQSRFCRHDLASYFTFQPCCPEMAIGMGTPRKTIRLVQENEQIRLKASDGSFDVTEPMTQFSQQYCENLNHLSGYVVCAKSPSCGMERISIYNSKTKQGERNGQGLFTAALMKAYPHLPVEEDGRLNDMILRENFVTRVYAHHAWQCLQAEGMGVHAVMQFHARYKYLLMAHKPENYKRLGPMVAKLKGDDDTAGFDAYFALFMQTLSKPISRKNHCNVLQHLQGYFKQQLNARQRQELSENIQNYRKGLLPLLAPIMLLQHYLNEYPNDYLAAQVYLQPHPLALKLRYGM